MTGREGQMCDPLADSREITEPVDEAMKEAELMWKMRDALADMYVMFMMPNDFTEAERMDTLNQTRDALDEYTKANG